MTDLDKVAAKIQETLADPYTQASPYVTAYRLAKEILVLLKPRETKQVYMGEVS